VAVKIRLKRMGKIRAPYYRIVVADSRTKRDGRVIEEIGKYHPTENPSVIEVKTERAQYWLGVGAQPTEQVRALLKLTGDWGTFKGDKNAKSTVKFAEPKEEFRADTKKKPVLRPKVVKAPVQEAPAAEPVEDSAPAADEVVEAPAVDEVVSEAPVEHEAPVVEEPVAVAEDATADEAPADEAPAVEEPVAVAEDAPAEDAETKPAG
jgi:small subunit ribosomal protein S16